MTLKQLDEGSDYYSDVDELPSEEMPNHAPVNELKNYSEASSLDQDPSPKK